MKRLLGKRPPDLIQTKLSFLRAAWIVAGCWVAVVSFSGAEGLSSAVAQGTAEPPEVKRVKESIVELYCRDRGRLAECVGLVANDCIQTMKPLVDECYPEAMKARPANYAARFSSCFSMAFNKHFGTKLRETEDCVQPSYHPEAVKLSSQERESIEKSDVFSDR